MDSQKSKNQEKIQLTDLELAVLKKDIAGEFFPPEATEEKPYGVVPESVRGSGGQRLTLYQVNKGSECQKQPLISFDPGSVFDKRKQRTNNGYG